MAVNDSVKRLDEQNREISSIYIDVYDALGVIENAVAVLEERQNQLQHITGALEAEGDKLSDFELSKLKEAVLNLFSANNKLSSFNSSIKHTAEFMKAYYEEKEKGDKGE
jgi:hypothetical protein